MSKHLLLADTSTPFAYLSLFHLEGSAKQALGFKKRELIFSIRDKYILRESPDETSSKSGLKESSWGDDWLMNLIKYLCTKEGIKKVDYLALGRGPGLFTSLRISHIVFRMLSLLWDKPTVHFPSMSFWHSFFCLKQNDTLMIKANRNLYYIYTPDRAPSFAAMTWPQWLDFAEENKFTRAFLWASIWNEKGIQGSKDDPNKINHKTHHEINIEIQELSLTTQIEANKGKTNQEFISGFINFADIENMIVPLEKFLPEYGHQV